MFENNGRTPHFTFEELKQIYEAAASKDTNGVAAAARELFPDKRDIADNNLYIANGPGRGFMHNGDYENPKHILVSYPLMTGIMKDGTIYPF